MPSHDDLTQPLFRSLTSRFSLHGKRDRGGLSQSTICWSASALSVLIAGAIVAYLMTSRRMARYARLRQLEHPNGTYLCEDVADDVREDIDYYQDPCEDFYAFACGKKDSTKAEDSVFQKVQDSLTSGGLPVSGHTAIVKTQIFHRSCMDVFDINATLRTSLETFFRLVDHTRTRLREMSTPAEILDFVADLSLRWGVGGFVFLSIDFSGNLVISVDKPMLSFMTEDQLNEAVAMAAEYLSLKSNSLLSLVRKIEVVDKIFIPLFKKSPQEEVVSVFKLQELTGGKLRHDDWINIVNAHAPSGRHLSQNASAILKEPEAIERALTLLLTGQDTEVTRAYILLHAVLPQRLLEVIGAEKERRKFLCMNLTRESFRDIWSDVVTRAITGPQTISDLQFMTTALVVTLKRLIRHSNLFRTVESAQGTLKKLDQIHFNLPTIRSDFTLSTLLSGMPKLNVSKFYANLLKTHRFLAARVPQDQYRQGLNPEVPGVMYQSGVIDVSAASASAPYVCYRSPIVLNYATIGIDIADELLNAVDSMFGSAERNDTVVQIKDLYPCAARLLKKLGEHNPTRGMLRRVIRLRGAFQLVSEATKLEFKRPSQDPVLPAVIQTFVARYCHRLCNATESGRLTARVRCNAAVMADEQFVRLFRCEQGQRMVPKRRCTVF